MADIETCDSTTNGFDKVVLQNWSDNEDRNEDGAIPTSNEICKRILGIDYMDEPEEAFGCVLFDSFEVSQKYGIPILEDPTGSYKKLAHSLIEYAYNKGVEFRFCSEDELKQDGVAALYIPMNNTIVISPIDLDNCTELQAFIWASDLSHELVHCMQLEQSHNMSKEEEEYEAHVLAGLSIAWILTKDITPEELRYRETVRYIFDGVEASSKYYYKQLDIFSKRNR